MNHSDIMKKNKKRIVIEPYRDGDETSINDLYNLVSGEKRELDIWKWKFLDCPINARPFILLAKDGDRILGHGASLLFKLKYFDDTLLIQHVVDYMFHPDCRIGAMKLSVRMNLEGRKLWKSAGIDCSYAFPNKAGYVMGRRAFKYKDAMRVETYTKHLTLSRFFAAVLPSTFFLKIVDSLSRKSIRFLLTLRCGKKMKGVQFHSVDSLNRKKIDEFWNKVKDRYDILLQRNYEYFNWRYIRHPESKFRILLAEKNGDVVGLAIAQSPREGDSSPGLVMECLSLEDKISRQLLGGLLVFLSRNKVSRVNCKVACEDPLRSPLRRLGFYPRKQVWDFLHRHFPEKFLKAVFTKLGVEYSRDKFNEPTIYQVYSDKIPESHMQDASKWHISFGDIEEI